MLQHLGQFLWNGKIWKVLQMYWKWLLFVLIFTNEYLCKIWNAWQLSGSPILCSCSKGKRRPTKRGQRRQCFPKKKIVKTTQLTSVIVLTLHNMYIQLLSYFTALHCTDKWQWYFEVLISFFIFVFLTKSDDIVLWNNSVFLVAFSHNFATQIMIIFCWWFICPCVCWPVLCPSL